MRYLICLCALVLVAAGPSTQPTMLDQCNTLARQWNDKFVADGFEVTIAPPFVIAGNTGGRQLAVWRDGTILAAKDALTAMYFKTPVDKPVLILLFTDATSYQKLSAKWLGERNLPHYGMYRHRDRTMLMNISTGGGTLVHELTHALIASDFPKVPDWFNEGFASLYEQCSIRGEKIEGHTNWRLAGLQKAIKARTIRPLKDMMEDDDFRHDERVGINYAQARYLMYYLQENGKLVEYYTKFRDGYEKDPTGLETLKTVLATEDLAAFDKKWQAWVMTLRF
jgi:hypothetical protein